MLADFDEHVAYILSCVEDRYTDPADELPYESAEGGYQGAVLDSEDLLQQIGLELPNDKGKLFDDIASSLANDFWCEKDYFGPSEVSTLKQSWREFVEVVTTGTVLEFMYGLNPGDREAMPAAELLSWLTEKALEFGLLRSLPVGHSVFRARKQEADEKHRTAEALGPPPVYLADKPNRMNPKGTVMMYASEDSETAFVETAQASGSYAIGKFELLDAALVLDLTDMPPEVCFFDLENAHVKDVVSFLRHFATQISLPVVGANPEAAYLPTQIVTQHFRRYLRGEDGPIQGIRFASAQVKKGINLAFFGESIDVWDEPPKRPANRNTFLRERIHFLLAEVHERTR